MARDQTPRRRANLIAAACLIVALALALSPSLRFGFVPWDDDVNVYANKAFKPLSLAGVSKFWLEPYEGFYIPLTYSLWAIQLALTGTLPQDLTRPQSIDAAAFHATNLALHLASAFLVFLIIRLVLGRLDPQRKLRGREGYLAPLLGACVFALHPAQAEVVSWVSGFRDILYSALSLFSIWQYLEYLEARRKAHYYAAFAGLVLALLSKPTAVVLPALFAFSHFVLFDVPLRTALSEVLPMLLWAAPFALITDAAQSARFEFVTPVLQRPLVALDSLAFYLYRLLVPWNFHLNYARRPKELLEAGTVLWTSPIPVLLGTWVWTRWRKHRIHALGAGLFVLALLPSSGIVPFISQNQSDVFDRYLYLPLLGPALIVAWLARSVRSTRMWVAIALCLFALGLQTRSQCMTWKDPESLYGHALEIDPWNNTAHYNRAVYLAGIGQFARAREDYEAALKTNPKDAASKKNLRLIQPNALKAAELSKVADAALAKKDFKAALRSYEDAISAFPQDAHSLINAGNIRAMQGDFTTAIPYFIRARNADPDLAEAYADLGRAYWAIGRVDLALPEFRGALERDSGLDKVRQAVRGAIDEVRAFAQGKGGTGPRSRGLRLSSLMMEADGHLQRSELDAALKAYEAALRIDEKNIAALLNSGNIHLVRGEPERAMSLYRHVLDLDPSSKAAYLQLGMAAIRAGRGFEALRSFRRALEIDPEFQPARKMIANLEFGAAAGEPQ